MKKGDFVKVKDDAKYSGQTMSWTEEVTGQETFKKGHVFYHFSDSKLTAFNSKTTCFYDENKTIEGHCYTFVIDQDITKNVYCHEVRFNLEEGQKLQYLGKVTFKRNYNKRVPSYDSCGRFQGCVPETKIIDNRISINI